MFTFAQVLAPPIWAKFGFSLYKVAYNQNYKNFEGLKFIEIKNMTL